MNEKIEGVCTVHSVFEREFQNLLYVERNLELQHNIVVDIYWYIRVYVYKWNVYTELKNNFY